MLHQKQKSALSGALFFNKNGDRGGNRTAETHIFSPVLDDYEASSIKRISVFSPKPDAFAHAGCPIFSLRHRSCRTKAFDRFRFDREASDIYPKCCRSSPAPNVRATNFFGAERDIRVKSFRLPQGGSASSNCVLKSIMRC